jgi:hypothetical protein
VKLRGTTTGMEHRETPRSFSNEEWEDIVKSLMSGYLTFLFKISFV